MTQVAKMLNFELQVKIKVNTVDIFEHLDPIKFLKVQTKQVAIYIYIGIVGLKLLEGLANFPFQHAHQLCILSPRIMYSSVTEPFAMNHMLALISIRKFISSNKTDELL